MNIYLKIGITLIIIAIIITIVSSFYKLDSTIDRIAIKISNVLQILLFFGIFISYKQYEDANKQTLLTQESILAEKGWVLVYEKIQEYYDKCPNFCNSLSYDWQIPKDVNLGKKTDLNNLDDYGAVLSLSVLIFQSFQNVLAFFLYYDTEDKIDSWLKAFIIWTNSKILYDVWNSNKFMYDITVQIFVDKIFELVRKSPPKNTEDIENISKKICTSDEIRRLFGNVQKKTPCE